MPVRQILVQLTAEGLVEIQPNKLKYIVPLNLAEMRHLRLTGRAVGGTADSMLIAARRQGEM